MRRFKVTKYTVAWAIWILSFFIIESAALRDRDGEGTLSEHAWRIFNIRGVRADKRTWIGRALFLTLGIWLTGHFAFGWWSLTDPCGPFC